jgi:hypothetical protein
MESQNVNVSDDAALVAQSALRQTRMQISEGVLEAQPWYQKLDSQARDVYRRSGRTIIQSLIAYLSSEQDKAEAEARSLGYEYASRGRRNGLSILDSVQAFLFFRNTLLNSMLTVYEAAAVRSPYVWSDMFRKINAFTDHIMLTILETYAAFDRMKP